MLLYVTVLSTQFVALMGIGKSERIASAYEELIGSVENDFFFRRFDPQKYVGFLLLLIASSSHLYNGKLDKTTVIFDSLFTSTVISLNVCHTLFNYVQYKKCKITFRNAETITL